MGALFLAFFVYVVIVAVYILGSILLIFYFKKVMMILMLLTVISIVGGVLGSFFYFTGIPLGVVYWVSPIFTFLTISITVIRYKYPRSVYGYYMRQKYNLLKALKVKKEDEGMRLLLSDLNRGRAFIRSNIVILIGVVLFIAAFIYFFNYINLLSENKDKVTYLVGLMVFVGVMITFIGVIFQNKYRINIEVLSKNRQDWINGLRTEVTGYLSLLNEVDKCNLSNKKNKKILEKINRKTIFIRFLLTPSQQKFKSASYRDNLLLAYFMDIIAGELSGERNGDTIQLYLMEFNGNLDSIDPINSSVRPWAYKKKGLVCANREESFLTSLRNLSNTFFKSIDPSAIGSDLHSMMNAARSRMINESVQERIYIIQGFLCKVSNAPIASQYSGNKNARILYEIYAEFLKIWEQYHLNAPFPEIALEFSEVPKKDIQNIRLLVLKLAEEAIVFLTEKILKEEWNRVKRGE